MSRPPPDWCASSAIIYSHRESPNARTDVVVGGFFAGLQLAKRLFQ